VVYVDARLEPVEDDPVRLQHVLQLPGVLPPAADDRRPHRPAAVDEPLDCVRDLELTARGRRDRLDRVEHGAVEHVHADEGQVGRRPAGLLDEPHHAVAVELGDAELLGIPDAGQEDLRRRPVLGEALDHRPERLAHEVVPEVHDERRQVGAGTPRWPPGPRELYRGAGPVEGAGGAGAENGRPVNWAFVLPSVKRPALVKRKPSGHVVCL
jgi:hypothetical protein